jgi:uncharacterized membrane protein
MVKYGQMPDTAALVKWASITAELSGTVMVGLQGLSFLDLQLVTR